jgi:hypothetical protein
MVVAVGTWRYSIGGGCGCDEHRHPDVRLSQWVLAGIQLEGRTFFNKGRGKIIPVFVPVVGLDPATLE